MTLNEKYRIALKDHAQREALRVADSLCHEFPHIPKEECRDAAQNVLEEWCDLLDHQTVEQPEHPYTWLHQSAMHRILDVRKHNSKMDRLEAVEMEPSHEPEAYDWEYGRDFVQSLYDAGLDMHERATVRLKTAYGWSWKKIAAQRIDGKSADALKQTYHRALVKLKRWAKKEKARGLGKLPPHPKKRKK
jgi:DNA-directed RNA polymerase specialized sigma24 family protein